MSPEIRHCVNMYLQLLLLQVVCWPLALALPAVAVEPDYDQVPLAVHYDSSAAAASEDTYTYRTLREDATPEKLVFRDTTPDSLYPWEEEGGEIASTPAGEDGGGGPVQTTIMVSSTAMETTTRTGNVHNAAADTELTATDAPGGETEQQRSGVVYRLYTRAHPIKEMLLQEDSVEGTDLDVGRTTVFVIHGFTGDANSESVTLVRDALLWAEDANVVVVDWAPLAAGPHYDRAVNNTHAVAGALSARIAALAAAGLPLAHVHLVGFSLGAQVAGLAGKAMDAAVGRIPRITALDPARPGFHDAPESRRLDASDAELVVVLHTASGLVSFEEPLGHVDFYANSGRSPQPACVGQSVHGTQEQPPKLIDPAPVVCSHLIAPRYFAESIYKPQNFRSTRCGSWRDFEAGLCAGEQVAFLGPNTPSSTRGTFFFRTNPSEPYGRGETVDDALGEAKSPANDQSDDQGDANRLDGRTARKHDPGATAAQSTIGASSGGAILGSQQSSAAHWFIAVATLLLGARRGCSA